MAPNVLSRLLLFTVLMVVLLVMLSAQDPDKEKKDNSWNDFKAKHGKKYEDDDEETKRRAAYEENVANVDKHNAENKDFTLGINKYADLTNAEFAAIMLSNRTEQDKETHKNGPDSSMRKLTERSKRDVPVQYDARTTGCFPPIKDQGLCGSCWAFAAATTLEWYTCYFNGNRLVKLSEQQLLDCTYTAPRDGCNGGFAYEAYNYVGACGGLDFASTYAYTGKDGACLFSAANIGGYVRSYYVYEDFTETTMRDFIGTYGPLAVSVNGGLDSFRFYSAGIYNDPACTTTTNHAVAVIGYGTTNGQDYWLIRNSYGTSWGEQGYMRLARNKNNLCGILHKALYPFV